MGKLVCLFLLTGVLGCQKDKAEIKYTIEEPVSKGPIQAKVSLEKKSLSILDTQRLRLEISAPIDYLIEYPNLEERLEDFRQVPWRSGVHENRGQLQVIEKYFAFELYESGAQIIPPFVIHYSSGSGDAKISGTLKTPILKFEILSLDDDSIWKEELKAPEEVLRPDPFPWAKDLATALVVFWITFAIIAYFVYRWKRRIAPPPPPIPAHELAYRELQIIVDSFQNNEIDLKVFGGECSNVLRRYIERRFDLKAPELTTEEFLNSLASFESLQDHRGVLSQYLEFIDLIKFAAKNAEQEEIQKGFEFIKEFIESTKRVAA